MQSPPTRTIGSRIFTERNTPYILLSPAIIIMLLIIAYPIITTIYYSMTDYMLWDPFNIHFVGLGNYAKLLVDKDFILSFINTVKWVVIILSIQFLLGLIVALLLSRPFRGRQFIRSITLIPWVTPSIMASLMWSWMYHGNYGVLNQILYASGIIKDFVPFLAQSSTSLLACMLVVIWQGMPFFALMLIAGLSAIPLELYEASKVDGAGVIQSFFHITLPGLKNTILVTTLLRTIWIANNVDIIYIMTGGGPANSSLTLSVNAYLTAQKGFYFGYASAMSVYLTLALSLVAVFYVRNMNIGGEQSAKKTA